MEYSISEGPSTEHLLNADNLLNQPKAELSLNGFPFCSGCSKEIFSQYYLRVNETPWHEECLRCDSCNLSLVSEETCFFKKNKIYCKFDYYKNFGVKCAKCSRNIQSSDWVRRAKENVYHLACFACESCKRQLSTGEEFALQNNKLLCKTHYCENIDGENGGKDENSKSKNKRVRTTFTEEQLQILQANFEVDSNPDGQDLERIAQITGLSKRVTQVWFQNSRARQKKYKEKKLDGSLDLNETATNEEYWTDSTDILMNKRSNSKLSNAAHFDSSTYHDNSSINNQPMRSKGGDRSRKKSKGLRLKSFDSNIEGFVDSWSSDNESNSECDPNDISIYENSYEYGREIE